MRWGPAQSSKLTEPTTHKISCLAGVREVILKVCSGLALESGKYQLRWVTILIDPKHLTLWMVEPCAQVGGYMKKRNENRHVLTVSGC